MEKIPKVLVIDDEPQSLRTARRILRGHAELLLTDSVREASQLLAEHRDIDAILLDIEMPERNGLDYLREIRERDDYRDTPVLMLTGHNTTELQLKGYTLGASDFLIKPVHPEILKLRLSFHIENNRLRRQLETLALTDLLTKLANRRGLFNDLHRELARTQRSKQRLSVAVLDIDHFKSVNDTYGHARGDRALRFVADALRDHFKRGTDILGRLGGEEFVIACFEVNSEDMQNRIEQCRSYIKAHSQGCWGDADIDRQLTVSVGGVTLAPSQYSGMTPELMIALADHQLYEAKRMRDTQCWITDPPQETVDQFSEQCLSSDLSDS